MKRVLSLFLSVLMLTSVVAAMDLSAYAGTIGGYGEFKSGNYGYNVLDDGTASIAYYYGNAKSVSIPSKLGKYKVTEIDEAAFYEDTNITKVTFPSTVTTIGYGAFAGCTKLSSVTLPGKLVCIEDSAFGGCESLTSIVIPDSVTSLGSAFNECTSLTSITIPNSVTSISDGTFQGCTNLKTVIIPDGVTNIKEGAFLDCTSLSDVYYTGSQSKWNKISIDSWNSDLTYATIHYNHSHTYKATKATTDKNGSKKCSVCGAKKIIYKPKTVSLSTTSYTYNGKAKKPTVKVKNSAGSTISSKNYTVSYINQSTGKTVSSMKNPGKYYVKVKFKGSSYSGALKTSLKIKPKKTSIKSITASSKGFTVKWSKVSTQNTGYQVQYSTSKSFKSAKTATISKTGTTSKKVTKLKAKKKYYVRVRTYKTVKINGKNTKIYSSWSSVKGVTTKK